MACLGHGDCTDPAAARCEGGTCVGCQDSGDCVGVAEGQICDNEVCVECTVDDSSACGGSQTCDLLASTCVDVAPGDVGNCEACTNDLQCHADARCVPMDFEGSPYGHYCLYDAALTTCTQPYFVPLNAQSINGASATDYCGIVDAATCEAVRALVSGWTCTGTDGMCGPPGDAEVSVPGAVCHQLDFGDLDCTYACGTVNHCPLGLTCGGGPPNWCGG